MEMVRTEGRERYVHFFQLSMCSHGDAQVQIRQWSLRQHKAALAPWEHITQYDMAHTAC